MNGSAASSINNSVRSFNETYIQDDKEDPKIKSTLSKITHINQLLTSNNHPIQELISLFNKLEKKFATLEKMKFPKVNILRDKIFSQENVSHEKSRIQKCIDDQNKLEQGILQNYDRDISFDWKFCDLKEFIILQERYDLLVKLYQVQEKYSNPLQINKLIFHLAMDKVQLLDQVRYQNNYPLLTSDAILKALSKTSAELQDQTLIKFEEWLSPLLKEASLVSGFAFIQYREPISTERIINNIKKLQVGESFLVPTGCSFHETCLLITKNQNNKFTLIHYNTGTGALDWNYRWKNSKLFQTFRAIDDVPLESILNKEGWKTVWESKYSAKSMDPTYTAIEQVLGKDGIIRPASPDKEDYEAIQNSCTCAMQVLMALMRHQIMERADGTKIEKEAYYKLVKAHMILLYAKEHWSVLENTIQESMTPVMDKLQADIKMHEIAKSSEQYQQVEDEITLLLKHYGEHELSEAWKPQNDNCLSRYAALRDISNVLSTMWIQHKERVPEKKTEAVCFALAKYNHKKIILNNLEKIFDKEFEAKNNTDLAIKFSGSLKVTPHEDFILDYIVRRFGKDVPPTVEDDSHVLPIFMKKLNINRLPTNHVIEKLREKIAEQGNYDLSQWIKDYWIQLEIEKNS